ncbi:hypothetical protein A0J61_07554 [Choanephora cucurbitarum]|uniref:Small VCP/p97-interacting protein n=1 Tax=Choanephora cucurbitarum TaxID=101091 RepID=A0A1C7N5M4_9FUNG|nr:hypothetical protein A0J61_07554 [Choanephora cucurbitarum]
MGNCCGSESDDIERHELKTKQKTTKNKGQMLGGDGPAPSDPDSSREARIKAAEKRKIEDEHRGVKSGGGKLTKQLMEQNKQPAQTSTNPQEQNLVWD